MKVVILDTPTQVADYAAELFQQQLQHKPASVFGLATGSTPLKLYRELIKRQHGGLISFNQAQSFNLDEYLGLAATHPHSYSYFMQQELFDHIDIQASNTHVPPGDAPDPEAACAQYERAIEAAGGIDLQLLGIGRNGHIGFNEPGSAFSSRTRVAKLSPETMRDNARFFSQDQRQPELSITMGIATIMAARQVILLATGDNKAEAVQATVDGPMSVDCPASVLQSHPAATVIVDQAAALLNQPVTLRPASSQYDAVRRRGR
ncbi:glucosamine-6-phosphate deaminase [Parahaliea sp. F7430]|uniref:Glucosamine-6-phosphate deaminase n=1 Tax=Sediminihaliea albiluteola TaxID=2758564 RepID=A0A7W2YKJ8_9GAMM|nr:glucosamine-6-phosphate deaminase [Sediminihaliea albiluteola]MBA6414172.1 glucosamine-6-phosphate deaminase [Sediminihaliea albiluteola]